jgi:hypothetical protein
MRHFFGFFCVLFGGLRIISYICKIIGAMRESITKTDKYYEKDEILPCDVDGRYGLVQHDVLWR